MIKKYQRIICFSATGKKTDKILARSAIPTIPRWAKGKLSFHP